MALFVLFVLGMITGWFLRNGLKDHVFSLLDDIYVGIAGGLIGGWLAGRLFTNAPNAVTGISVPSILLITFLAAVMLIVVIRLLRRVVGVRFNTSR